MESRRVTRPDIVLAHVLRWLHTEISGVAFALLNGLVMAAHSGMLASSVGLSETGQYHCQRSSTHWGTGMRRRLMTTTGGVVRVGAG